MELQPAFFHADSGAVRFWVLIDGQAVGASVSRQTLHYGFRRDAQDDDPLDTYKAYANELEAAVRRRAAKGSREPVMLREFDLRAPPA
jgi:hypothetical protein